MAGTGRMALVWFDLCPPGLVKFSQEKQTRWTWNDERCDEPAPQKVVINIFLFQKTSLDASCHQKTETIVWVWERFLDAPQIKKSTQQQQWASRTYNP